MKKVLIGILVLVVLVAVFLSRKEGIPGIYKTYKDPEGAFTFQYPSEFKVSGREKNNKVLARVTTPAGLESGTNFQDGELVFGWSNDPDEIHQCLGKSVLEETDPINFRRTTMYKKVLDGDCYTFAYTLHSKYMETYDPKLGIKEFNEEEVSQVFEKIIKSFRFLISSD